MEVQVTEFIAQESRLLKKDYFEAYRCRKPHLAGQNIPDIA